MLLFFCNCGLIAVTLAIFNKIITKHHKVLIIFFNFLLFHCFVYIFCTVASKTLYYNINVRLFRILLTVINYRVVTSVAYKFKPSWSGHPFFIYLL